MFIEDDTCQTTAWYIGFGIFALGPSDEALPLNDGWTAYAYLFRKGDSFSGPSRGVATAIGYTSTLARWNLENTLQNHGYNVINLVKEAWE